jgi:hypothetical protein
MAEPRIDNGAYVVADEPDPLRAAAHIISDMLATNVLQSYRRDVAIRALKGDIGGLHVWERDAVEWLIAQIERDADLVLNAWVYDLVRAVCAKRGIDGG